MMIFTRHIRPYQLILVTLLLALATADDDNSTKCNNEELQKFSKDSYCTFAKENCEDDVPFAEFYYCNSIINGNIFLYLPIMVFGLGLCF